MSKKTKVTKVKLSEIEKICYELHNLNAKYSGYTDVEYNTYHPCKNGSNCCDNDYCRCGQITDLKMSDVNIDLLRKALYPKPNDNVLNYCLDRILVNENIYSTHNWDLSSCRGYYGEELADVSLNSNTVDKITTFLKSLEGLSDYEKIIKILEHEYGYILPMLETFSKLEVKKVKTSDIIFGSNNQYVKVSKQQKDYYKDYTLPRAVVKADGNKYNIIDGYHRIFSAKKEKLDEVEVIILS